MPIKNWSGAINQFAILFDGRVPMGGLNATTLNTYTEFLELPNEVPHQTPNARVQVAARIASTFELISDNALFAS